MFAELSSPYSTIVADPPWAYPEGFSTQLTKANSAVVRASQAKQHSRKPAAFGDLIEQVSPGPYVELFARAPRLGWDSWGYGYESGAA